MVGFEHVMGEGHDGKKEGGDLTACLRNVFEVCNVTAKCCKCKYNVIFEKW